MQSTPLITFAACAWLIAAMPLAHASKTAGETFDDSTLATSTKAALVEAKGVASADINVEVYKGRVQLGGFVSTAEEERAALNAAMGVKGHSEVIDALVVVPGGRSMGATLDDTTIQTKLKAALADQMSAEDAATINTDVRRGEVLLSGWVADSKHKDDAGKIAQSIHGVSKVHNELSVKP